MRLQSAIFVFYTMALLAGTLAGCEISRPASSQPTAAPDPSIQASREPITPLSEPEGLDPDIVALGRALFHDNRLSRDNTVSCATCHVLERAGVDHLPASRGIDGLLGHRNAPTVFNAARNYLQFWDGRARTLEEQIDGPIHNQRELASDWPTITAALGQDPTMKQRFREAFGSDEVSAERIKRAIADFERTLITVNSPFDRYLAGQPDAIGEDARAGYALFKDIGCSSCHQGANVGGNMFQRIGVTVSFEGPLLEDGTVDLGRYAVTGDDDDQYVFRVPSLRLAAATPPYFHDGGVDTLEEAIQAMAWHQLGRILEDEQTALIAAFLRTLPGEYQGLPICPPDRCP